MLGAAVALEPRLLRDDASTAFKGSRLFDPEAIGGWKRDSVREVGVVTGCLLLAPRALWRELGGFDPRFFMYGEDADLSMRAWARGLRPAITPDAVITHEIGVSSASRPDKLVLLFRGKATLLRKHWSPPRRALGLALLRAASASARCSRRAAPARADGAGRPSGPARELAPRVRGEAAGSAARGRGRAGAGDAETAAATVRPRRSSGRSS